MDARILLRRVHLVLAFIVGIWLALLGATGAVVGLRDPLLAALNATAAPHDGTALPPSAILLHARADSDGALPMQMEWRHGQRWRVYLRTAQGDWALRLVDPISGASAGEPRAEKLIEASLHLHRQLVPGAWGAAVAGASCVLLVFVAISGVYLRWRSVGRRWAHLLVPRLRLRGRGFWMEWHGLLGTALMPIYLLIGLTGIWLAFAGVRHTLATTGWIAEPAERAFGGGPPSPLPPEMLDTLWQTFRHDMPDATEAQLPLFATGALVVSYLDAHSPHERALSRWIYEAGQAKRDPFEDEPAAARHASAVYPLHAGSWFGSAGSALFALASLLMPVFLLSGLWLWWSRRWHRVRGR